MAIRFSSFKYSKQCVQKMKIMMIISIIIIISSFLIRQTRNRTANVKKNEFDE